MRTIFSSGMSKRRGIFGTLMEESGKINLKGLECKTGMDLSPSRQAPVAQSYSHY
jgi:hypothetical protein